jgi:hypothetical protein
MTNKMKKLLTAVVVASLMLAITPTSPAFERHPEIRAAIDALHNAKDHLEHASHDFKGHRVDAISAINEADRQLHLCLEAD